MTGPENNHEENETPIEESESTRILREAFGLLSEYGFDTTVTDKGDHTEIEGPDTEPPATQP
ncbi:MAG: hypothetical protein JWP13_750 [Candidatus Saccharibacteria bacterium]|nr:hypothetical protein [Candidatus Saccharibacteria bacterium]